MRPILDTLTLSPSIKGSVDNSGPSLARVLHFFDVHSGSMQAIAAIVLVIVTIIYTILTRRMAKAARDALRPYVYLDFTFPGGSGTEMLLTVGNSGSKVAADVRVKLTRSSREDLVQLFAPLPLASIGHLSPAGTRKYSLIVSSTLWPQNQASPVLDFEINYHDGRHKITEMQRIDFAGYLLSAPPREGSLGEIASTLENISRNMPSKKTSFPFTAKICPYCASQINSSAKKCPNCLEWISGGRPLRNRSMAISTKVQKLRPRSGRPNR